METRRKTKNGSGGQGVFLCSWLDRISFISRQVRKGEKERKLLAQATVDARLKAEEERKAKAKEAKRNAEAVCAKATEATKRLVSNEKPDASIPIGYRGKNNRK